MGGAGSRQAPGPTHGQQPPCLFCRWTLPSEYSVLLGALSLDVTSSRKLLVPVLRVLLPPDFSEDEARGDLALLQLRHPVSLSARIQPVCLPAPGSHPPPGAPCWVTGWGSLNPGGKTHSQAMETGGHPILPPALPVNPGPTVGPQPTGTQTSLHSDSRSAGWQVSSSHCLFPLSPLQAMLSPDSQISPSSLSATPRGATLTRSEGATTGLSLL